MSEPVTNAEDSKTSDEFMSLLMGHRHRLFAYIAKQLVNASDVEDVFQKTSVVLWKKMDQFDSDKSFFHWACGIAFNEVRNFLTVQRRDKLHFDAELVEVLAEEAAVESDQTEARLAAMRGCMSTFPEDQQDVLQRCYAGTESIAAVADKLGRERGAFYKQVARLKDKMLDCIRSKLTAEGATT